MIGNKKIHISVKVMIILLVVFCGLSAGGNLYLHKNYDAAFAKEESHIEEGKSELIFSDDNKYSYRINEEDNSVEIIAYLKNDVENLKVPEYIDGQQVTGLGEAAFAYHDELKSVEMPKTINTIKMAVFGSCVNLEKVYFPADVENIEEWAFGDYFGSIVTVKGSNLFKYAESNDIKVEEIE